MSIKTKIRTIDLRNKMRIEMGAMVIIEKNNPLLDAMATLNCPPNLLCLLISLLFLVISALSLSNIPPNSPLLAWTKNTVRER